MSIISSNASGYLGYPSLTTEVFHGRLGGKVSKRYGRTGDVGKGKERFLFVVDRTSDTIKIDKMNGETELYHCHYLETSAYESCPNLPRGGCIAAFQISPKVIGLAAELQVDPQKIKGEKSIKIDYKKICQGIDESVVNEYGDIKEVDRLVILVRGGSLPKTTSGKLQRWAARYQVMRGEMVAAGESIATPLNDLPWLLRRRNVVDFKRVGKQVVEFQIFFHDNNQLKVTTHCLPSCHGIRQRG